MPPVQEQSSRRAIYAIIVSMGVYVIGDTVLKLLGRQFPPSELIFWRSCIILITLTAGMWLTRPKFAPLAMV